MKSKPDVSPRFFVSYCVDDKRFVIDTCNVLRAYLGTDSMFLFEEHPDMGESFLKNIKDELNNADFVIFFVGRRFNSYQDMELFDAICGAKPFLIIGVNQQKSINDFPKTIRAHAADRHHLYDEFTTTVPPQSFTCACKILSSLNDWLCAKFKMDVSDFIGSRPLYGLPLKAQLFDYEKNIIEFYSAQHNYDAGKFQDGDQLTSTLSEQWSAEKIQQMLDDGVPANWPKVYRYERSHTNHLDPRQAGVFRAGEHEEEALVRAAALMKLDRTDPPLTFPEAGPRRKLAFPQADGELNVAILVAGGIAPGINAVIDAIVQRHHEYLQASKKNAARYTLTIHGIKNGFLGIDDMGRSYECISLDPAITGERATRGGAMLGTSRDDRLLNPGTRAERLEYIAAALSGRRKIDILYVIGGDGGMKAAHALWHCTNRKRERNEQMAVVTIPKTMDNDILWVWKSFGFLSAVDESRKIVETLHTEVRSNPRLGIVQLFGSDSGFVVSHAVLASAAGHTYLALIPEIEFSAIGVARYLKKRLWEAANPKLRTPTAPIDLRLPHGLVVLAETAVPLDTLECLGLTPPSGQLDEDLRQTYAKIAVKVKPSEDEIREILAFEDRRRKKLRLEGQTSDAIRRLGLRIMAEALPAFLKQAKLETVGEHPGFPPPAWDKLRVVCSEPRHLVRSMEPSTSDIITGQRLGLLAVDAAMAGYTDCMVSQWLTEFALVPLELVMLGRKRIPPQGMFWKSVVAKTRQDRDLVSPWVEESPAV